MHSPTTIKLNNHKIQLSDVDFSTAVISSKQGYLKQLSTLQKQLKHIQQAYFHQQLKALIVFEGWDASGKGGAIRRIAEPLDPRSFRVFPIAAPSVEELSQHYLHRFFTKLPRAGHIHILDRSYYGRVLVERVEGFASHEQWQRAYQEINEFERLLTDDNTKIIKIFLHITPEEQAKRFLERLNNPYKRWKLTQEDLRNREKWPQYQTAINDMLAKNHTQNAPWHLIPANKKWFARIAVLQLICQQLADGVDITPPAIDSNITQLANTLLNINNA